MTSFLIVVTNNHLKEVLRRVIYRDDGLLVFKGRRSMSDIRICRGNFQEKVDKISGNDQLQFTCDTCYLGASPSRNETKNTSMVTEKLFLFLDLELFWYNSGK